MIEEGSYYSSIPITTSKPAFHQSTLSCPITKHFNSGEIDHEPQRANPTSRSNNNGCGLNGNDCRPFQDSSFAFRCPADCLNVHLSTPHAIGDQDINYSRLVIGGPSVLTAENSTPPESLSSSSRPIYRADSFICQAAIHAGAIKNELGGCGVVSLLGHREHFPASAAHGVKSYAFDSDFPKAYTFETELNASCGVVDLRWPLLAVTVVFTALLSLFTSSPLIFFASVFVMLFFHVGLVSDPPNIFDKAALVSRIVERFLPAAFVAVVIYRYCIKPQLSGLTAHVEKTVLWLGGAWVGALNNYTFDFIPIQRLTPHDLAAQPDARLALVLIVLIIFAIALGQIWYLRLEGRFPRYLAIYATFGVVLITCVIIPHLNLRIHHYILALLLLPGTRMQTRPSLFYQGLLVGLFVNGVARWGFDSILQTSAALYQGGPVESLLPNVTQPVSIGLTDITFAWDEPPEPYDGVSILVNDVERHRWYVGEGEPEWKWIKPVTSGPQYFRFAYMRGSGAADYTKAGVWDVREGSWEEMESGPSR